MEDRDVNGNIIKICLGKVSPLCYNVIHKVIISRAEQTFLLHNILNNLQQHFSAIESQLQDEYEVQGDSKRLTHFLSLYGLNSKRRLNTRQTVGCGIPSSLLVLRVDLRGLRSKLS